MHRPLMRPTVPSLAVALACAACARPAPGPAPVAVVPCPLPGVGSAEAPWRQVRGTGFTFCIPASWQPRDTAVGDDDPHVWAGEGSSAVTWGVGRPPVVPAADEVRTIEGTITSVPQGTVPPRAPEGPPLPPSPEPAPCPEPRVLPYRIGLMSVIVTHAACNGTWTTTAWSTSPSMYVRAVARSAEAAQRQLAMMETIRATVHIP